MPDVGNQIKPNAGIRINDRREETLMDESPILAITRQQLYDEIWEISVAGVAKKYDLPYAHLMKQIKAADIPVPPSGYWVKLGFGKPVTKLVLPEPVNEIISISKTAAATRRTKQTSLMTVPQTMMENPASDIPKKLEYPDSTAEKEESSISTPSSGEVDVAEEPLKVPATFEEARKLYNIYDRHTLYKEVWEFPVTEVAKKYRVSDVTIHKVCKSLDIPTPPAGYWAKLRAGKLVAKPPLSESSHSTKKTGLRAGTEYEPQTDKEMLAFLEVEERTVVLSIAEQIVMPDENAKMHPTIIAHRKAVTEWKKKQKEQESRGGNRRAMDTPPFLADTVSEEKLPRVLRMIDTLIKAMEPLDCSLTNELKFVIYGETISLSVTEAKDEVKHVPTQDENMQLVKYEEYIKRRGSWASKPNIRKYDHVYNGRISFTVHHKKTFRDCKSYLVEERLGDIMIELYEASNLLRIEREEREAAERKRQKEERQKEERKKRYNTEVDRTVELVNIADDFDTACKIRRYIMAIEASGNLDQSHKEWIEWAKAKADWYDPTIAKKDDFLGKREHGRNADQKKLEHAWSRW